MKDLNHVTLCGRLARDPETRVSANSGTSMCMFTLACGRGSDKDGNDRGADFISIKAFGKLAEICDKYLSKGKQVIVSGAISTGSYEKDGRKVYTTDVLANEMYMTGSKSEDSGNRPPKSDASPVNEQDDDIPF